MGKFPGLELSLCKGPVAGSSVENTEDPLKGEGVSGTRPEGWAGLGKPPQHPLLSHICPSPWGTAQCPPAPGPSPTRPCASAPALTPQLPGAGSWAPGPLPKQRVLRHRSGGRRWFYLGPDSGKSGAWKSSWLGAPRALVIPAHTGHFTPNYSSGPTVSCGHCFHPGLSPGSLGFPLFI